MFRINYTINPLEVPAIETKHRDYLENLADQTFKEAFRYRYALTPEQHDTLQSFFPDRMVCKDTEHNTLYSSHPILAILNDHANVDAGKIIHAFKNAGPTISIGDPLVSTRASHNCNLLNTTRDAMRFAVNGYNSDISGSVKYATLHNKHDNKLLCLNGAQNCHFNAHTAVAVHSMYDVTMEELADIFINHNLQQMFVYMYLPINITNENFMSCYKSIFTMSYLPQTASFCFAPNDGSVPYIHNADNWRKWFYTTQIKCGPITLVFERTKIYGPYVIIRINKVYNFNTEVLMSVPIDPTLANHYFVPNIKEAMAFNFAIDQSKLQHFQVPKHVVNALMSFASRQDEGFTWPQFAIVAGGHMRQIRIGKEVFYEKWDADINDYNCIVFSLFILAAIMRTDRTKTISATFAHLKKWQNNPGITFALRQWFYKFANRFEPILSTTKNNNPTDQSDFDFLWGYKIKSVHQKTTGINLSLKKYANYKIPEDPVITFPTPYDDDIDSRELSDQNSEHSDDTITNFDDADFNVDDLIVLDDEIKEKTDEVITVSDYHLHNLYVDETLSSHSTATTLSSSLSGFSNESKNTVIHCSDVTNDVNEDDVSICASQQTEKSIITVIERNIKNASPITTSVIMPVNTTVEQLTTTEITSTDVAIEQLIKSDIIESITHEVPRGEEILPAVFEVIQVPVEDKIVKTKFVKDSRQMIEKHVVKGVKTPNTFNIKGSLLNAVANFKALTTNINGKRYTNNKLCINSIDGDVISLNTDAYVDTNFQTPRRFIAGGHCFLYSFWQELPKEYKPSQNIFIRNVYFALLERTRTSGLSNEKDVHSYIFSGNYNNTVFDILPMVVSTLYNVNLYIYSPVLNRNTGLVQQSVMNYGNSDGLIVNISYTGNGEDGHYIPGKKMAGGKATKFAKMIECLKGNTLVENNVFVGEKCKILDMSAAPGMLFMQLDEAFPLAEITLAHYTQGLPMRLNYKKVGTDRIRYEGSKRDFKLIEYKEFTEIKGRYDLIICDAALPVNSEAVILKAIDHIPNLISSGSHIVCKSFGNIRELWAVATGFQSTFKIKLEDTATESYFFLHNFLCSSKTGFVSTLEQEHAFREIETKHTLSLKPDNTRRFFEQEFFNEIKTNQSVFLSTKLRDTIFGVTAVTGVASCGKTHHAAQNYPDALFIAPTKECSLMHNKQYHVRSYTPHNALSHIKNANVIVVDEISLIPCEYLHLIKSINPSCHLIVVGDVHQVPFVSYTSKRVFTHISKFGIVNNNVVARSVPMDIAHMMREKLKIIIFTTSTVVNSIYNTKEPDSIKHLKHLCFNDESCKTLISKGLNASTITTYQGSRSDDIVFYIDDKAITSQLINRTEWVYTAMTRARNKIVLYGQNEYIEQFFHIDGTLIRTYEEYSELDLPKDVHLKTIENGLVEIPISCLVERPVSVKTDTLSAITVLETLLLPANPTTQHYNSPNVLPPIEQGSLTCDSNILLSSEDVFSVNQLYPETTLIINQVNNSSRETIRTAVGRYTLKTKLLSAKTENVMANDLLRGFAKAIFGDDKSLSKLLNTDTKKGLLFIERDVYNFHYKEYLISLQDKIKEKNVGALKEIETPFDPYDEMINFINKRQGKFNPDEAFDTTDKVGQGVASFSKRINLIYSAYARAMLHHINSIFDNGRNPNILLAVFDNNVNLNIKYRSMMKGRRTTKWFCSDVSQWDSRWNQAMSKFMYILFENAGMPKQLLEYWYQVRQSWKMKITTKNNKASLKGKQKQFSGNPFTILENTVCNLALTFLLYEFQGFECALFKGDDSAIYCDAATLTEAGKRFLEISQHKLKQHFSDIGEFASFILTDSGMVPNLPRKAAKILGASYDSQEHLLEVRKSVHTHLETIDSEYMKNVCCLANSIFYDGVVSQKQCEVLFDFLATAMQTKWPKLNKSTKYVPIADN
jgi:hypothetical protein